MANKMIIILKKMLEFLVIYLTLSALTPLDRQQLFCQNVKPSRIKNCSSINQFTILYTVVSTVAYTAYIYFSPRKVPLWAHL